MAASLQRSLYQPIITRLPEPGRTTVALTLDHFLALLRAEEDYYPGEQNNTKLMITRLRKIFYDQWGWNSELIRGAKSIEDRYTVAIVEDSPQVIQTKSSLVRRRSAETQEIVSKRRIVTYKPTDRQYPDRVGKVPEIYANDNQEIVLPEGYYCDVAHVLAGLDAINYFLPVSPLPTPLLFMRKLFPSCDSNVDVVTWLGDVASAAGDFVFEYLKDKHLTEDERQNRLNIDASAADMLGDIDPYIIAELYDLSSTNGMRVSDILYDYYNGTGKSKQYRERRFSIFCNRIGLQGWNGTVFENEKKWLKHYKTQLRDAAIFCEISQMENVKGLIIATKTWFRCYEKQLDLEELLCIFLDELKKLIAQEPQD